MGDKKLKEGPEDVRDVLEYHYIDVLTTHSTVVLIITEEMLAGTIIEFEGPEALQLHRYTNPGNARCFETQSAID